MQQEELNIEGPGGLKAGFKGAQTLHFLVAILLGAWVWYVNFNQDSRASERDVVRATAMKEMADAIAKQTKAIEQVERSQRAQIYVLTLSQKERERLNLVRPEVLYEMQGYPRER